MLRPPSPHPLPPALLKGQWGVFSQYGHEASRRHLNLLSWLLWGVAVYSEPLLTLRPEEAFWSSDWLPPHTARVVCFGLHDPNRWRVYIPQPDGEWLLGSISGTKNLLCDGLVAHSQCGRHWLIWKHLLITAEQSWNCFPWKMTKTSFRVKVLTRLKQQTSKETFKKSF